LFIIAEINVFDWKEEYEIENMFRQVGIEYSQVIDWKIYDVDSGGDSYIYVIANNKPTIAQLKEASKTFKNFTEDTRITLETSSPYITGYYDEEDEKEKDNKTKLQEVSKMFSPLDRWSKKAGEEKMKEKNQD
jgi:hypothetical protein